MSDIQFKSAYREKYNLSDVSGPDIPHGLYEEWNRKFKAWEERRGLAEKRGGFHYGNQTKVLRGAAARSVKRASTKKPGFVAHTNIVGKCYATRDSGMRAIRRFVQQNSLDRDDFDVQKVDWGCYKIIKKGEKVVDVAEVSATLVPDESTEDSRTTKDQRPSESFLSSLEERFRVGKV